MSKSDDPFVSQGKLASRTGHADNEMMEYMKKCAAGLVKCVRTAQEDSVRIHITSLKLSGYKVGEWLVTVEKIDSDVLN